MNNKRILNFILFTCLIIACMFFGFNLLIRNDVEHKSDQNANNSEGNYTDILYDSTQDITPGDTEDIDNSEPWLSTNPSDNGTNPGSYESIIVASNPYDKSSKGLSDSSDVTDTISNTSLAVPEWELIYDSSKADYKRYIPEMVIDSDLQSILTINNPQISIDAKAAILFDVKSKKVLFYKNPVEAVFPASTAKLLTSLVALDRCDIDEQIQIGDEITMIAPDSTRAYLRKGEILTLKNLLEGMLLPSGNDAAYAIAAYVGRKSIGDSGISKEKAISEFVRLMNEKAKQLGVKNSCFKTPDGYDAFGQYTTAYDMGLIGMAAAENETIVAVSNKASSRNVFISGEDVTWNNTNKLITKYSGQYYSYAQGLKTGTSTMAGRCLISSARDGNKEVVCVIMNSSATGRWEDAIKLLKYGLQH